MKEICLKCGEELKSGCGVGGCFFWCVNRTCERYAILVNELLCSPRRLVFMNTPILTVEGKFIYKQTTVDEIKSIVKLTPNRLSAIGHQSTAEILSSILDEPVEMNRIQYVMEPTDLAIVLKLNGRPEEGKILSKEEIEKIGYKFYLLELA